MSGRRSLFDVGVFLAVIGVVLTIVFTLGDVALLRTDMELLLAVVAGVLYATGLYLMLRRRLAQLIIGLGLLAERIERADLHRGGGDARTARRSFRLTALRRRRSPIRFRSR